MFMYDDRVLGFEKKENIWDITKYMIIIFQMENPPPVAYSYCGAAFYTGY
jgi:hypothetical protein